MPARLESKRAEAKARQKKVAPSPPKPKVRLKATPNAIQGANKKGRREARQEIRKADRRAAARLTPTQRKGGTGKQYAKTKAAQSTSGLEKAVKYVKDFESPLDAEPGHRGASQLQKDIGLAVATGPLPLGKAGVLKSAAKPVARALKIGSTSTKATRTAKVAKATQKAVRKPPKKPPTRLKRIKTQTRVHSPAPILAVQTEDKNVGRVLQAPVQLAKATAEDPKAVGEASYQSGRDAIVGAPRAVIESVTNPKKAAKMIVSDVAHRYGPLVKGDTKKFREQVKHEGGITPFAFDALVVAPPAGRVAGAVARRSGAKVATAPRPKLRTGANRAETQRLSPNLITAVAQRKVDKRRKKVHEKKVARLEPKGQAPAVRAGKGEVVPLHLKKIQTRRVAARKGRYVAAMKAEQGQEVNRGVARDIRKLNKDERRALKYVVQLGLPANAKRAVAALRERKAQILASRGDEKVHRSVDEVRQIDRLIERGPRAFTARVRETADRYNERSKRAAESDPGLVTEQVALRRVAPQAEFLGITRREGETEAGFVSRVREAAAKQDLHEGGYVPSQLKAGRRFSEFAVGGTKAIVGDKRYTGALFRKGIEDTGDLPFVQGLARNIKRKYNWNLVGDTFDSETFAWGRNKPIAALQREVTNRGIDPNSVMLWNPRKFREQRGAVEKLDADADATGSALDPEENVGKALTESSGSLADLETNPAKFTEAGWSVVPKTVYDELHASTTKSTGALARSADIAKQKSSRIILGSLNIPWLQFQVASNAILTGIAGTGPLDFAKAQVWWRKLSDEQKRAVEPYVGVGSFQADVQQTKLGAAANNRLVNAWRALKETKFGRTLGKGNPFDALFRADNAQNNVFRRSVLYSQAKRNAYRRMGENANALAKLNDRFTGFFGLGPQQQMAKLLKEGDSLEAYGKHLEDFLGDYSTFTHTQRAVLARNVMWYAFLRFSLRFAFRTLPIRRPVMTGVLGQLARLEAEEVRQLLGGDELPFALGRWYMKGGKFAVDLSRGNPVANSLTSAAGVAQLSGLLPPYYLALVTQITRVDPFTGKQLKVRGETQARPYFESLPAPERLRILARQGLNLYYPYRTWEKLAFKSVPQGADTLAFSPRPTGYVRGDIVEGIQKEKERHEKEGVPAELLREMFPFLPRPNRDIQTAASFRESAGGPAAKVKPLNPRKQFERFQKSQALQKQVDPRAAFEAFKAQQGR